MPLSLAILRQDLRTHLGMDELDLPDSQADLLLNRAWWMLSSQLRFSEKDAVYDFSTTAGDDTYALPTDSDAIQKVILQEPGDDAWEPLTNIADWDMFKLKDTDLQDRPTHYSRRGSNFILWPNRDNVYDVSVKYLRTLADIQASGPDAPQEWHEVILWGAVSRGFYAIGDWTRGQEAQAQQSLLIQSLDTQETKEHEDRVFSGLRVYRRRYP